MTITYNPALHVPDINHWEGLIEFPAFFLAGPHRVITKLTEGAHFGDPLGGYALRVAAEAGRDREAYHYLDPLTEPAIQAAVFARALYGCYFDAAHEQTWLDVESVPKVWRVLPTLKIRAKLRPVVLQTFRVAYHLLGAMPGCYTRPSFWNAYVGPVNWSAENLPTPRAWLADYGRDGEGGGIAGPRWIDRLTFPVVHRWQFTDRGIMPGVPSRVDLNRERV